MALDLQKLTARAGKKLETATTNEAESLRNELAQIKAELAQALKAKEGLAAELQARIAEAIAQNRTSVQAEQPDQAANLPNPELESLRTELADKVQQIEDLNALTTQQDAFIDALYAKLKAGARTRDLLAAIEKARS